MGTVRVAAVQYATGTDVDANLATLRRMVAAAAAEGAQLVVTPEFGNHLSVYESAEHAWNVAVDIDGPYVEGVRDCARRHEVWLVANATVRRDPTSRRITITNLLFSPQGDLVAQGDKTVLMGSEADHLSPGLEAKQVVPTSLGVLGLYSCMEGVMNEPARCLALGGAEILCNSLNSFALDEASLHIPVRAAENKVFVVAANKVGPLAPPKRLAALAGALDLDPTQLHGAGESQIVAPDGTVLAMGPHTGEAVVIADIDPAAARDKREPSGTDVFEARRPSLYRAIAKAPEGRDEHPTADSVTVATRFPAPDATLVVLPEFAVIDTDLIEAGQVVVTARRNGDALTGVVLGHRGRELHTQDMLHSSACHPWAVLLGDEVGVLDLPWGRLAVLAGEDHLQPEAFRLAALASADVVAVATGALPAWQRTLGLRARAAENRMNIVAGATEGGVVVEITTDFTLWTPWEEPFAGEINRPRLHDGAAMATIHPVAARNRFVSKGTDVVDGRPWRLLEALTG